jgi:hypothetical protein
MGYSIPFGAVDLKKKLVNRNRWYGPLPVRGPRGETTFRKADTGHIEVYRGSTRVKTGGKIVLVKRHP